MTETYLAFATGALLVACIMIIGIMNAQDIKTCQRAGNSLETCYAVFK
jgi:hypothetical protein